MSKSEAATSLWRALKKGPLKILVVGGGNWGTVIARIAAMNAQTSYLFDNEVSMWLHEEEFNGKRLTQVINESRENPKYLPGIALPQNLTATANLIPVTERADLIIFVLPHQFVEQTCQAMKGHIKKSARAISLVKGLQIVGGIPRLFTSTISEHLGVPCCILSGANIANDIARDDFSETTLGYTENDANTAAVWQQLFDRPTFKVNGVPDIAGVEVCGAVKNVVALGAGFCDGLKLGTNTKAAIIRLGVEEMRLFANVFFDSVLEDTFHDSAGYADVITTCFGGRNVRCAAEFVLRGSRDWNQIEADLLGGQKMQGHLTCKELHEAILHHELQKLFPLFTTLYKISYEGAAPSELIDFLKTDEPRPLKTIQECTLCPLRLKVEYQTRRSASDEKFS